MTIRAPEPMKATIADSMPAGRGWFYEQKYDGMRVIAVATARSAHLITRNGRDKRAQFPEIADALRDLARRRKCSLVLDGEIVALRRGKPVAFQALQGRLHRSSGIAEMVTSAPAAIAVFDVLRDGRTNLTSLPMRERRERLVELLESEDDPRILVSDGSTSGKRMIAKARRGGWEGLIAKRLDSTYVPGARSNDWLKLKLQHRAEFVVGGYTEPRLSREYFGALLLGYFERDELRYAGNMGGGFNHQSLREMYERLEPLARKTSPFVDRVKTREPAHWVRPQIVVEVKFAEWTEDGKLRQPIFLGVRDDKAARDVHRERESVQQWAQEI
jgi:bifunctional non-homologous end joining protein LigD